MRTALVPGALLLLLVIVGSSAVWQYVQIQDLSDDIAKLQDDVQGARTRESSLSSQLGRLDDRLDDVESELELRWPRLADYLAEHPDLIDAVRDREIPGGARVPADLAELLVSDEVRQVVLSPVGGPLTSKLIRAADGAEVWQGDEA